MTEPSFSRTCTTGETSVSRRSRFTEDQRTDPPAQDGAAVAAFVPTAVVFCAAGFPVAPAQAAADGTTAHSSAAVNHL
ncbi:hypothetical protein ABZ871_07640 [Streptomyces populi]